METPRLQKRSCELAVRVTPRSSQNKLEYVADQLKVWVMSSPTDGQANDAVCQTIAKAIKIAPSSISIKRGHTSRDKLLLIEGLTQEEVHARLAAG